MWASLPPALWDLRGQCQWVLWRVRGTKKVPYQAKLPKQPAKVDDPSTWGTYEEASAAARNTPGVDGIGFVLTNTDIVLLDFDNCRDPATGNFTFLVERLRDRVKNCYTEVSPSGTGLHIYGRVQRDRAISKLCKLPGEGKLEIYCRTERYTTVTGEVTGAPECPRHEAAPHGRFHRRVARRI